MNEDDVATLARHVVAALRARHETVATAESLTGGLLCAALVDVPGASAVVRGAVVAYAPEVKVDRLGVESALVEAHGTVDARVAAQMAAGVRETLGASWGLATTGVAGPDPSEGKPVGTVHVALHGPGERLVSLALDLAGDRGEIRRSTVAATLRALAGTLGEEADASGR